jgi:hypothetical protein
MQDGPQSDPQGEVGGRFWLRLGRQELVRGAKDSELPQILPGVAAGRPLVSELAAEQVTAVQLADLETRIEASCLLVGAPRGQVIKGSTLRTTARKLVAQLRETFANLDTRMDSLGEEDEFQAMVIEYEKARIIVDAGQGPKDPEPPKG